MKGSFLTLEIVIKALQLIELAPSIYSMVTGYICVTGETKSEILSHCWVGKHGEAVDALLRVGGHLFTSTQRTLCGHSGDSAISCIIH
eukprot:SAG31_NODE_25109_length_467_cov_35.307065_1_plen_87_part_10